MSAQEELTQFFSIPAGDKWKDVQWSSGPIEKSQLPWLSLELPWKIPPEILEEARKIKDLFVLHRHLDGGYGHKGWKSLCIHGLSATKTMSHEDYGISSEESRSMYNWTEIARRCPVTVQFFKETFSYVRYERLRFMLLEAGGYILPHKDNDHRQLGPINIALNNPAGCEFYMRGYGKVPFAEGQAYKMDVGVEHAVWNKSNEDRFHIIVHGEPDFKVWKALYPASVNLTKRKYESGAHLY